MIRAGFTIENPRTGSQVTVLESAAETAGRGWLLEHRYPARATPDIPEHLHLAWTETFEIVSGTATYKLNGETKTASAGETVVFPPGVPHIHPWNASDAEMVCRQRDDFGQANPQAVQDVLGVFATTADLARAGLCDKEGKPRNPLQLAVTVKTLARYGGYDASIPIPVQNFLAATLGTLGEALGYRAVDPKYLR